MEMKEALTDHDKQTLSEEGLVSEKTKKVYF